MNGMQRYEIDFPDGTNLDVMVDPNVDFDGTFKAFCNDEQEWLNVNGWLADRIEPYQQEQQA